MRHFILAAILLIAGVSATALAADADYPVRPIRLIVPYPPGAGTDGTARIVAEALGRRLGQQIVVENKPGASGVIGTDLVAKSPADGYTLLWTSTDSMAAVPALRKTMPYKVPDDFTYVGKVAETGMALVVKAGVPAKSIPELIAFAKANPAKMSYGSSGTGGLPHLATLLFEKYAGFKMTHVPYKGVAPALTDLLGGQIDFALLTPITIAAHLGSDKMRIIGITAAARHPLLPDAPTVKEAGIPQATATVWYGLFGPRKLPPQVLERLLRELAVVVEMPSVKERMAAAGLQMAPLFGEEFERAATGEYVLWQGIVKAEGITVDE